MKYKKELLQKRRNELLGQWLFFIRIKHNIGDISQVQKPGYTADFC